MIEGVDAPMETPDPPQAIAEDRDNGDRRFYELWTAVWEGRIEFTKKIGQINGKWERLDGQMKIILVLILGLYAAMGSTVIGGLALLYFR